jgi:hypothetical protein
MKLSITRDQAKGLLGGVKFELSARAQLTNDESELVKKYKADKVVLLKKKIEIPFTGRAVELDIKIENLLAGQTFKCADVNDILETEKNVKEAAQNFKTYIEIMKNFGGQEVIEYS